MSAIVINTNSKNSRILAELAKELGAEVTAITDSQWEELKSSDLRKEIAKGWDGPTSNRSVSDIIAAQTDQSEEV